MEGLPEDGRTEYDKKDVRYTCYSLLQNISFKGEPVVPKILSDNENIELEGKSLGTSFKVESLPGIDLSQLVFDEDISLKDKLLVLKHVVGQLKAIDAAGYVLFDRHGDNIRVLKYGVEGVSTRQVDIEDLYIKSQDEFLSNDSEESWKKAIAPLKEKGLSVWCIAVWRVAVEGKIAAEVAGRNDIAEEFDRFTLKNRESIKNRTLQNLEQAVDEAIEKNK